MEAGSYQKILVKAQSWVKRFIEDCRSSDEIKKRRVEFRRNRRLRRSNGKGATEEKQQSRISESQKINYRVQYQGLKKGPSVSVKSKPANLNPVIDKDGLLRCNERMKHVKSICPMILDIQ